MPQSPGVEAVKIQIGRRVDEHLVYRIDVNVLRGDGAEIDRIDLRADVHVVLHLRRRRDEIRFEGAVFQLVRENRFSPEGPESVRPPPFRVDGPHFLVHLEEPRASGDPVGFQGGGDGEADRLFCPARVCHDEIGFQRVESPFHAFHGGVEGFEVDRQICFLHVPPPLERFRGACPTPAF